MKTELACQCGQSARCFQEMAPIIRHMYAENGTCLTECGTRPLTSAVRYACTTKSLSEALLCQLPSPGQILIVSLSALRQHGKVNNSMCKNCNVIIILTRSDPNQMMFSCPGRTAFSVNVCSSKEMEKISTSTHV